MNKRTSMKTIAIALALVAMVGSATVSRAQSAIGTVVTLTGYFLNAQTLTPVEANYVVLDDQGKKIGSAFKSSVADGYLQTGLKPGATYIIRVEDPRYFRQEYKVEIPSTGKYMEISKDFVVRAMVAGRTVAINPAPFELRKSALRPGAEDDLDEVTKILVMNPSANIEIVCYPDAEASAADIQKLSAARAESLKRFFVAKGVSASRISLRAVSTLDPIDPPPIRKAAKGKRYIGPSYLVITKV